MYRDKDKAHIKNLEEYNLLYENSIDSNDGFWSNKAKNEHLYEFTPYLKNISTSLRNPLF